jgi:hypothetical protein
MERNKQMAYEGVNELADMFKPVDIPSFEEPVQVMDP